MTLFNLTIEKDFSNLHLLTIEKAKENHDASFSEQ